MLAPLDVPVDLTREQARRLAEHELADPAYRAAEPSLVQRAIAWVVERIQDLVDRVGDASPGGWVGILGLLALVVLVILLIRWRMGPVSRSAAVQFAVDPGVSADQYRARAEQRAAAGDWDAAVSERMRAVVRTCQDRGLIDSRPGWTADEVAQAAGAALPTTREAMAGAAHVFDDVRYGGRRATADSYARLVAADDLVRTAMVAEPVGAGPAGGVAS